MMTMLREITSKIRIRVAIKGETPLGNIIKKEKDNYLNVPVKGYVRLINAEIINLGSIFIEPLVT